MSKNWNQEQLEAITTRDTNILVSASAGSGKTGVLVQRLVELVTLDHIEIDEILAMTFSEDAANEMKKRLSGEITRLVSEANDEDKIYLQSQLSKLSNANISTIHSFCYSILKNYYYLLGLSSKRVATLCDEATLKLYQDQILEEIIDQRSKNEEFQILCSMLCSRPEDLQPVKHTILKIANMANSQSNPSKWLESARKDYSTNLKDTHFYQVFMDYWHGRIYMLKDSFEALFQQLNEHYPDDANRYEKLSLKYETIRNLENSNDFDLLKNHIYSCAKLVCPTSPDASNAIYKENRERIAAIEDEILSIPPTFVMDKMIQENRSVILELFDCVDLYFSKIEAIKNEKEVIDFSDMEHYALVLLREFDEVSSYYRNKFKQIMVDEFQDSNDVQDELVALICKENNVFRVGDVKQSIYGFRHALPSIMQSYKVKEDHFNKVIRFNRNYRSDATIVEFNNVLYEILMNIPGFDSLPFKQEDLSQIGLESQKENNQPIVFHALNQELKSYEGEKINKDIYKAEYIANQVLQQAKTHKFSEICVLVRNNAKMEVLRNVFNKYNIPCYMNQKSGFYESRSIQLLISLLSSLCNPQNDFHFAAILTSVFFKIDSSELATISRKKTDSYYDYFKLYHTEQLKVFDHIRTSHLSISEMILECFKWNNFYDTCSFQDQTNCDYFYELALNYEKNTSVECTNFLSYINSLKEQQTAQTSTIGKNDNVVRFMSIHNSKGLEFPIVYLWSSSNMKKNELSDMVLCDNELGVGFNIMQFPYRNIFKTYQRIAIEQKKNRDEIEEELRILYVATTRAKKELHIVDFLNPKLELDKGINYTKVNARKGYTSWILQAMVYLNRPDLFRIQFVDELWTTTPIPKQEVEYEFIERYYDCQVIEYLSPSETENTHFEIRPLSFEVKDAASRGTLYHTYIEKLPNIRWNESMIQETAKQYQLYCDSNLIRDLLKLNENILFDALRNTNIYHEYPFIVQDEQCVLQGYMDYLSMGDKIVLIDFKSDFVNQPLTFITRYRSQIESYKKALMILFPDKEIETYIYSFHLSEMIQL